MKRMTTTKAIALSEKLKDLVAVNGSNVVFGGGVEIDGQVNYDPSLFATATFSAGSNFDLSKALDANSLYRVEVSITGKDDMANYFVWVGDKSGGDTLSTIMIRLSDVIYYTCGYIQHYSNKIYVWAYTSSGTDVSSDIANMITSINIYKIM